MPIRALPNGRPIPPHSLVAIDRNRWSPSTETGGRLQSKRLVVFNRNSWSSSAGVRSHLNETETPAPSNRDVVCCGA